MKKIFSLFIIAVMVLTMSITSFAATVSGMKTTITETDDDITVTVTVGNVDQCSSITHYIKTTKVTYVADSYVVGTPFDGASVTPTTDKSGYIKFVLTWTDAAKYITNSGEFVALTYKVAKTSDDVELSASDFTYGTGTLDVSKVVAKGSAAGVDTSSISGNAITSKKNTDAFTVEYVDNRTGGDDEEEETTWKDTVTETNPENYTESIKFPTASNGGQDGAVADVTRKTVMFAKNTTGAELAANSYGIKVGEFFYPGKAPVSADQYWSIILLTTEADRGLKNATYAAEAIVNYGTDAQESQSITLTVK